MAIALVVAPGCGDPNAGALFADVQYATRCEETLGCPGPVNRDICGINVGDPCEMGAPQARVSCTIDESPDGSTRTLNFSASQGSDFNITVIQAVFNSTGGSAAGAGCRVRVTEGPNRYEGACGSSPPSVDQPCQISALRFYDDMGNPTLEGAIQCAFLPNQSQPSLHIELTQVGSGPGPASMPGRFRIANCMGLEVEPGT